MRIHRELVGCWIPLSRYFREELLVQRFGELARGPKSVISAYEQALLALGCDVAMASYREQDVLRRPASPQSLLICNESYIVAESFELTRLE